MLLFLHPVCKNNSESTATFGCSVVQHGTEFISHFYDMEELLNCKVAELSHQFGGYNITECWIHDSSDDQWVLAQALWFFSLVFCFFHSGTNYSFGIPSPLMLQDLTTNGLIQPQAGGEQCSVQLICAHFFLQDMLLQYFSH